MKKSLVLIAICATLALGAGTKDAKMTANSSADLSRVSRADLEGCIIKSDEGACSRVARDLKGGCDGGDKLACFFYADMLGRGLGVEKDAILSFELFKAQCDGGSSEACYELSVKYLQGSGTPQSFELSSEALNKACKMHNKRACAVLDLLPKE